MSGSGLDIWPKSNSSLKSRARQLKSQERTTGFAIGVQVL